MSKKPIIYFAAAILLGFGIMMLPKALQTGPPTYEPELTPFPSTRTPETNNYAGADRMSPYEMKEVFGLHAQPSSLLPSGAIVLTGLAVALGVYIILKKRAA